jgi:hypothetical protein
MLDHGQIVATSVRLKGPQSHPVHIMSCTVIDLYLEPCSLYCLCCFYIGSHLSIRSLRSPYIARLPGTRRTIRNVDVRLWAYLIPAALTAFCPQSCWPTITGRRLAFMDPHSHFSLPLPALMIFKRDAKRDGWALATRSTFICRQPQRSWTLLDVRSVLSVTRYDHFRFSRAPPSHGFLQRARRCRWCHL